MKKSLTWWPSHWKLCALFYDAFRLHTFLSFHVYLSFHNSFMICHDNEDDDDVLTQITATALHCPFSDSRFLCVSYDVWYTFINTIFGSKGKRESDEQDLIWAEEEKMLPQNPSVALSYHRERKLSTSPYSLTDLWTQGWTCFFGKDWMRHSLVVLQRLWNGCSALDKNLMTIDRAF